MSLTGFTAIVDKNKWYANKTGVTASCLTVGPVHNMLSHKNLYLCPKLVSGLPVSHSLLPPQSAQWVYFCAHCTCVCCLAHGDRVCLVLCAKRETHLSLLLSLRLSLWKHSIALLEMLMRKDTLMHWSNKILQHFNLNLVAGCWHCLIVVLKFNS